jgi:fringe protein
MKRRSPSARSSRSSQHEFDSTNPNKQKQVHVAPAHRQISSDAFTLALRRLCFRSIAIIVIAAISIQLLSHGDGSAAAADEYLRELSVALGMQPAVDPSDLVFFTVRTTLAHQRTRVQRIIDTYGQFAPESFVFFTDAPPTPFQNKTGNELPTITQLDPPVSDPTRENFSLVNTLCSPSHEIWGWCCKTACEIVYYYEHSNADWMCHLDDDTYLNYPAMIKYLNQFDPKEEHYIGFSSPTDETWLVEKRKNKLMDEAVSEGRTLKPSTYVATKLKDGNVVGKVDEREGVRVPFFGTGGAGWCLSRPLVERGIDDFANLQSDCFKKAHPDDVMLGYVINEKLGVAMKQEPKLNSHLDAQDFASRGEALQQLTLGLGNRTEIGNGQPKEKVFTFPSWPGSSFVDKKTGRPPGDDPLGFRELHCALYPDRCR